jgi:hypothetical protein
MTPTQRSYLISFVSGAVLGAALPVLDLVARGEPITTWQPIATAAAGGLVLFLRDWLKNNAGARLEKPDAKAGVPPTP